MKVLLAGFGPFADHQVNPAEALVTAPEIAQSPWLDTLVLPTCFDRAPELVVAKLEQHPYRAVMLFGLAATAPAIRLERFARNTNSASAKDNAGVSGLARGTSVRQGPAAYATSFPLMAMARSAWDAGVPVNFSDDAGGFVCNHTFYCVAHHISRHSPATRCGFVHLPKIHDNPTLSLWATVVTLWTKLLQSA